MSKLKKRKKKACWRGWTKRGMKKKGDRMVNNCIKDSKRKSNGT